MADINGMRLYPEGAISALASAIRSSRGIGFSNSSWTTSQMASEISLIRVLAGGDYELTARVISKYETSYCYKIGSYAFYNCSKLSSINLPNCSIINSAAFYGCSSLKTAILPLCTETGTQRFRNCSRLSSVVLDSCKILGNSTFYSCYALITISLPGCTNIRSSAFQRCTMLQELRLYGSSVVNLNNINAFSSTPISTYTTSTGGVYGSIYVPSSLLASYKSATNWITYSNRMVGI